MDNNLAPKYDPGTWAPRPAAHQDLPFRPGGSSSRFHGGGSKLRVTLSRLTSRGIVSFLSATLASVTAKARLLLQKWIREYLEREEKAWSCTTIITRYKNVGLGWRRMFEGDCEILQGMLSH